MLGLHAFSLLSAQATVPTDVTATIVAVAQQALQTVRETKPIPDEYMGEEPLAVYRGKDYVVTADCRTARVEMQLNQYGARTYGDGMPYFISIFQPETEPDEVKSFQNAWGRHIASLPGAFFDETVIDLVNDACQEKTNWVFLPDEGFVWDYEARRAAGLI